MDCLKDEFVEANVSDPRRVDDFSLVDRESNRGEHRCKHNACSD